jgi:hypothetical protein
MSTEVNQAGAATAAQTEIVANVDKTVDTKEFKFRFKKDDLGNQRPSVTLNLPVPSVEGIIEILQKGGKGLEFLLEVCADTVRGAAVGFVQENEQINQENFPVAKILWDAIANAPRAERKTIAEEVWVGFAKDYLEIMPGVTGKKNEQLQLAIDVYLKKLNPVKTNKEILKKLKAQFDMWVANTKSEEFAEIVELLNGKFETYLKADDVELLAANL